MTKTVLITGCSSGIGKAAAQLFASRGWNVIATMRNPNAGSEFAPLQNVQTLALDVTQYASIQAAVAAGVERFGTIDALVNNAGFGVFGPFETASQDLIERQINTNLIGVFNMTRVILPIMRTQRHGTIINIASVGGLTTLPLNSIYHATKYAVVGFTEALVYELAPFGINAKVICPGGVVTDFAGRSLSRTFEGDRAPYDKTIKNVFAAFQSRSGSNYSQPMAIAEVIFTAATDSTQKIKYIAGADGQALIDSRLSMTEADYIKMMNQRFGLASG